VPADLDGDKKSENSRPWTRGERGKKDLDEGGQGAKEEHAGGGKRSALGREGTVKCEVRARTAQGARR
jgi:hypothetical protein